MIDDSAIQQAIDYANDLNADYIFVTNGDYAMTAKYEADSNQYALLSELPDYQSMLCGQGDYLPEVKPKERFAKRISNSENQIAKQLNTTGNIYEADIEEIKKNQEARPDGCETKRERRS